MPENRDKGVDMNTPFDPSMEVTPADELAFLAACAAEDVVGITGECEDCYLVYVARYTYRSQGYNAFVLSSEGVVSLRQGRGQNQIPVYQLSARQQQRQTLFDALGPALAVTKAQWIQLLERHNLMPTKTEA